MTRIDGMESLLIAENEVTVKLVLKKILERVGYKVFDADNGEDAVALFKKHREISLVLSNLAMPKKNGKEMLTELRKINPGVKALYISGLTTGIIHDDDLVGESEKFMTKPFKGNDLLNKIRELLDND